MTRYIVVETYYIGRTVGVNCEQMIEFTSKIKKANPVKWISPFWKRYHTFFFRKRYVCFIAGVSKVG
jgi:hypothetical protein